MVASIIAIVLGVLVGIAALWLRRGASTSARSWTQNTQSFIDDRTAFLLMPGLAWLFLGIGFTGVVFGLMSGIVRIIFLVLTICLIAVGAVLCFWSLLPVKVPRRMLPIWRKLQLDSEK